MKKIAFSLIIILSSYSLQAQTANEIVNNYIENTGGYKNWKNIKNITFTKKIKDNKVTDSIVHILNKKGNQLFKFSMNGNENIDFAFNGKIGWRQAENQKPKRLSNNIVQKLKSEKNNFPNPFIDFTDKGLIIELLGKDTINGTECFKIKLFKNSLFINNQRIDNIDYYYFSTETFLPVLIETNEKTGMFAGKTKQTYTSDFRDVDGLFFPFEIKETYKESSREVDYIVLYIKLNQVIGENIFDIPKDR